MLFFLKKLLHCYFKNTTQRLQWSFCKEQEIVYPDEKVFLETKDFSNQIFRSLSYLFW